MTCFELVATAAKARFRQAHEELLLSWRRKLLDSVDACPIATLAPELPGEPLGIPGLPGGFWTSVPIIEHIFKGSRGGHLRSTSARAVIGQCIADYHDAVASRVQFKLQHNIYQRLHALISNDSLSGILITRSSKYLADDLLSFNFSTICWGDVFHMGRAMSAHVACCMFKTYTGAWLTSRRLQQEIRPCIFCRAEHGDQLQHYVHCDLMWLAISNAFVPFRPLLDVPSLPGLSPLSPYQLYGTLLAYHIYHRFRLNDSASQLSVVEYTRALIHSCPIGQHLTAAWLGKVDLRFLLPPPASSDPFSPIDPLNSPTLPRQASDALHLNNILRMTHARLSNRRARGCTVPLALFSMTAVPTALMYRFRRD